ETGACHAREGAIVLRADDGNARSVGRSSDGISESTDDAFVLAIDPRDEMSLHGGAQLADRLKKDNYEVQALTFSKEYAAEKMKDKEEIVYAGERGPNKTPEVPKEVDGKEPFAIVIAGASSPIP